MAIFKAKVQTNYTVLPNSTAQDINLSFEARGLLAFMLSLPEDWDIHKTWLIKQAPKCGRDKLTRLLKELQSAGYVVKKQNREPNEEGKFCFTDVDWLVYSEPQSEQRVLRCPENPESGKPATTKETVIQKKQNNKRNNTDSKQSLPEVTVSKLDPECYKAISFIKDNNLDCYTGKLTVKEWNDCELAMGSVDFELDYLCWWMDNRSQAFKKKPSLVNMLCDFDGLTFDEFYEKVYLTECDDI